MAEVKTKVKDKMIDCNSKNSATLYKDLTFYEFYFVTLSSSNTANI